MRSRSRSLCFCRNFSRNIASPVAGVIEVLEPDHFSYFSSKDLILSSNEGLGGVISLSLEFELMLGGLGGGDAGGGTCTGLGGRGFDIRGLVTAGGLESTLSF